MGENQQVDQEVSSKKMARIQQDNELKESVLQSYHKEELQDICSQAENELKESVSSHRKKHEAQITSENFQHEEDCQKLQDELELQKLKEEKQRALLQWKVTVHDQQVDKGMSSKKEEKQRALLQLQWKVMGENQQVDQEESSKKVTHHEYEVETSNGRITKRRKTTKSTVMFGVVPGSRPHPANISGLFSEGSSNPSRSSHLLVLISRSLKRNLGWKILLLAPG